jgi:thiamine-phosphate pyrophosphorylase
VASGGGGAVTARGAVAEGLALCLVTDRAAARRPLVDVVEECLDAGLRAVQLREKDLPGRALFDVAERLVEAARRRQARVIVNDRLDVALGAGAAGVQRTHASLPTGVLRRLAPPPFLIGASVHARAEAVAAAGEGADYLVFGPIYDTPSKRAFGAPQGLRALEDVASAVRCPVLAVGGITPARTAEVLRAGARGVAAIGAILGAERPADAVKAFLDALGRA